MRNTLAILMTLALGFGTGWFAGSRRASRYHNLMAIQHSLQIHQALQTTNIIDLREATENYMSEVTIDAALGSDLFRRYPALVPKLRAASTNFANPETREITTQFLDEAEAKK